MEPKLSFGFVLVLFLLVFACVQEPQANELPEGNKLQEECGNFCGINEECLGEETTAEGKACCLGECVESLGEFPEFPELE